MNRTLLRQLARTVGARDEEQTRALLEAVQVAAVTPGLAPEVARLLAGLPALLARVEATYEQGERDSFLHARSLELSSQELRDANQLLNRELESRRTAISAMQRSIRNLLGEETGGEAAEGEARTGGGSADGVEDLAEVAQLVAELVSASAAERVQLDNIKFALDQHAIVTITDTSGTIQYANDKMCAASGYARGEIVGSRHEKFRSGTLPPSFYEDLWAVITSGRVWSGELCERTREGKLVWFAASIVPMLDESGQPTSYIAIRTDISERKRIESELERARDEAQSASVAKSRFLATMSHELRTPLNGILGVAELLKMDGLGEEQSRFVETILTSGQILLAHLNDLLDLSKIEAGKMNVAIAPFNPHDLLCEVISLFEGTAGARGIELRLAWEGSRTGRWRSDPQRVTQIVANLVSNAIKFTDHGSVVVRGRVGTAPDGSHFLLVDVVDTGIGIASEDLDRLFQPFQQLDDSDTRRHGGTGLGLSIVRNLAQLLHGSVEVESEPGRGSAFHVRLPLEALAEIRETQPAS